MLRPILWRLDLRMAAAIDWSAGFWPAQEDPVPAGWEDGVPVVLDRAREAATLGSLARAVEVDVSEFLMMFVVVSRDEPVRRADPDCARLVVLALVLSASNSSDPRDQMLLAAPVWHACGLVGLDPAVEFEAAATAVDHHPPCQEFVDEWLNRADEDRSLASMGFRAGYGPEGFTSYHTFAIPADPPPVAAETLSSALLPADLFSVFDLDAIAQPANQVLPSPLDAQLVALVDRAHGQRPPDLARWRAEPGFYKPARTELGRLASTIGPAESERLMDLAVRLTIDALRTHEPGRLYHAAIALAIAAAPGDPAGILARLAVVWYGFQQLAPDGELYRMASTMVPRPLASRTLLTYWLRRPPQRRTLDHYGWRATNGPHGITFTTD